MKSRLVNYALLGLLAVAALAPLAFAQSSSADKQIYDNMFKRRAVEAVMRAMPLVNFQAMRDGMARDNGAGPSAISYFSRPQDWHLQITTPKNNTLYVMSFWNTKTEPIVIGIPKTNDEVSPFGTLMDAWQRPAVLTPALLAQASPTADLEEAVSPAPVTGSFSSSSEALNLSSAAKAKASDSGDAMPAGETATRPFSAFAVGAGIGVAGVGVDIATPLARKFNLRGTGYFFRYNVTITENLVTYGGDIQLASGGASLDWFPFAGSFRTTLGVTAYNGNELTGSANIKPNESFTLNGDTYYSSATDPAHASATLRLGTRAAPNFSFGWGNMVPRKSGKHFSFPVAIGFAYVGQPKVDLVFGGSTCNSVGTDCQTVANDPTFQSDLAAQKAKYQSDLSALRFYPILSVGIGYKF